MGLRYEVEHAGVVVAAFAEKPDAEKFLSEKVRDYALHKYMMLVAEHYLITEDLEISAKLERQLMRESLLLAEADWKIMVDRNYIAEV